MFEQLIPINLENGETITYRESNEDKDKQIILLIHGNMSSSYHFNLLFDRLGDEYRLIAPDLRGFGGSSYVTPIDSLNDFAQDIAEVSEKLKLKKAIVVGWSTGGGVAMELAINHPELVEKLILIESVGIMGYPIFKKDNKGQPMINEYLTTKEEISLDPVQVVPILTAIENRDTEVYRAIWNALIYTENQPEPSLYNHYLQDMLTQRNLVDVDYALVHFNISDQHNGVVNGTNEVRNIKVPTLVFQGQRDYVVPMEMGIGIYEALKENAIYKTGDFGHSPFIDCLDELVSDIKDFIIND